MTANKALFFCVLCCGAFVTNACVGAVSIQPASPVAGAAVVGAGDLTLPNGKTVSVAETRVEFDEPQIKDWTGKGKSPANYEGWFKPWEPWPGQGKPIALGPGRDPKGVPVLGRLYRSVLLESVVVTTADGSKTFTKDVDYKLNEDWGQIANLNDGLGAAKSQDLKVACRYAMQRIDLIQVDKAGKVSVKKGKSALVCPMIPTPDKGAAALAGVYIKPWRTDGSFVVEADDIQPIDLADPVQPINAAAVSKTLAKLKAGETVKIALMGDSITLGAEACQWWNKAERYTAKDLTYRGRVIHQLRKRFPKATIEPVEAFQGGKTTKYGKAILAESVLPSKPDLVLVAFGANDATSSIGGKPRLAPAAFNEAIAEIASGATAAGAEVILITPMRPNPFLKNGIAKRIPAYRQAILDAGERTNVGVADVYTEWMQMKSKGIVPYTQLHNWNNHPGAYGHQVYADVVLRFFE